MTAAVLDDFWKRFNDEMDANAVVQELVHEQIIPQSVRVELSHKTSPREQNQILHEGLKRACTEEALLKACDIIIGVKGHPRMHALGEDMKTHLQTSNKYM